MPVIENPKLEVIRQLAEKYGVTVRTIYRWERDGVNLADPCEVGLYLSRQKKSAPAAVAAVKHLLETELQAIS
jgi:transcriptional regulator with XRE-family HTH domain